MSEQQKSNSDAYPIFILGSGRSGTTLIQRLLNSYDDTMIWGEHHGFLSDLSRSYFLLKDSASMEEFSYSLLPDLPVKDIAEYYKKPEVWQAWINWFNKNDVKENYKMMVESFFTNQKVGDYQHWGFKEIRYDGEDNPVIPFLRELYPDSKFVIITRNGLNVIESQVTTFHRGESKYLTLKRILQLPLIIKLSLKWKKENAFYSQLLVDNKEDKNIINISYETFLADDAYLQESFRLIGKTFTQKQYDIINMSSGRGGMKDHSTINERWKRMGLIPSTIVKLIISKTNKSLGY